MWAQIQQQQAQRIADQAEAKARALQGKAHDAQAVADRAQETARSLSVQSVQAQGKADTAQRGVSAMASGEEVQAQLSGLHEQIAAVLSSENIAPAPTQAPTAVVNSFGQTTGGLVNVTA